MKRPGPTHNSLSAWLLTADLDPGVVGVTSTAGCTMKVSVVESEGGNGIYDARFEGKAEKKTFVGGSARIAEVTRAAMADALRQLASARGLHGPLAGRKGR